MKSLHNNESGFMEALMAVIIGLFFLAIVVWFIFPIENFIANTMVEMGSPFTTTRFIQKMMAWSIGLMGVSCIGYGVLRVYRKTYDTGFDRPPGVL